MVIEKVNQKILKVEDYSPYLMITNL